MRGLGRLCLASLLLRAPRAVRAALLLLRPRTACFELAPQDAALAELVFELGRAVDERALALASGADGAPVVAEVHRLAQHRLGHSQQTTVIVTVGHGPEARPLVVYGEGLRPRAAARSLVAALERG
jgi:hypothetical protein